MGSGRFIALLLLTAISARAEVDLSTGKALPPAPGDENPIRYLVGTDRVLLSGQEHLLALLPGGGRLIVNQSCARGGPEGCMAQQALKYLKEIKVPSSQLTHGRRLGAAVCDLTKGGVVIVANDTRHNEIAVCYFEDQSFILVDSLAAAYRDLRPKPVPRHVFDPSGTAAAPVPANAAPPAANSLAPAR